MKVKSLDANTVRMFPTEPIERQDYRELIHKARIWMERNNYIPLSSVTRINRKGQIRYLEYEVMPSIFQNPNPLSLSLY